MELEATTKRGCALGGIILVATLCLGHSTVLGQAGEVTSVPDGKRRGLVILAEFPGIAPRVDKAFARERFNKLGFYVREMSYGKVAMEVDITGWHRLPDPIKQYAISPANLRVDRTRIAKLIQDAIDAADEQNDFSRYSFAVLFLGAQFREYGMVGLCGYPGMLGWAQGTEFRTKRKRQTVPGGVAIFTQQAHLGTLFHDIAHVWGGVRNGKRVLPCLYDHDIQAKHPTRETSFEEAMINMGFWDPLSCHFRRPDMPPPGVSSWTKLRLGWIAPEKVRVVDPEEASEVVLNPLEDGAAETLTVRIPLKGSTFYLIENRQPMGFFDRYLPGSGVLIMYADDSIGECRHGKSPVRLMDAAPAVPDLQGAAFDLPGKEVFTDTRNNFEIRLMEKVGQSYRIRIGPLRAAKR